MDHFRLGNEELKSYLLHSRVVIHPFVIGELACGNLTGRSELLRLLNELPHVMLAGHEEVMHLVESKHLYGSGIGWTDAHLLASALLANARIWTYDAQLRKAASCLRVAAE